MLPFTLSQTFYIYFIYITFSKTLFSHITDRRRTNRTRSYFQTMYPYTHKQAKQAPYRTESTSLSKCQLALKTAPHAPRFAISKKLNSPTLKCFKTRMINGMNKKYLLAPKFFLHFYAQCIKRYKNIHNG